MFKLQKSIRGIKQADKAWSDKLNQMLQSRVFEQGNPDPSLYIRLKNGRHVYIHCYAEDPTVCAEDKRERWK